MKNKSQTSLESKEEKKEQKQVFKSFEEMEKKFDRALIEENENQETNEPDYGNIGEDIIQEDWREQAIKWKQLK